MSTPEQVINESKQELLSDLQQKAELIRLLLIRETKSVINEYYTSQGKLVATGELRKSIAGETLQEAGKLIVEVFPNTKYAVWAHEGTKPHYPPVSAIARWVVRKGLAGKFEELSAMKRKGSIQKMSEEDKIQLIAKRIARSIAKKGTKGVKFLDIAGERATPRIDKILGATA